MMTTNDVSKLAQARGCILRITLADNMPLYWVENHLFIGKPYNTLEDVVELIEKLPSRG